jgi:hypothetical protein
MKIRRGLGKVDDAEADRLVSEMNQLLADDAWWNITQRDRAARQFAPAIVSAFYDPLEPEVLDTAAIREAQIPMPDRSQGYVRVQFVGTTGAGKTTLLRHLIGSDPKEDCFPSTSTAKCTIADIEVIIADTPYEAIVTFFHEWRIHTSIVECLIEAGNAVWEGLSDDKIAERLLHHSDQKFRLNYVLGSWKPPGAASRADDDWSMPSGDTPEAPTDEDGELPELPGGHRRARQRMRDRAHEAWFAQQWDVEYDTLRPVADLVKRLEESILKFLEKPLEWSRRPKDEDEAEAALSPIRQQVSAAIHDLARQRIAEDLCRWCDRPRGHQGRRGQTSPAACG